MEITAEGRAKINSTIAKVTGDRKYREAELLAELYMTQFQVQKLEEAKKIGFYEYIKQYIPESIKDSMETSDAIITFVRQKIPDL